MIPVERSRSGRPASFGGRGGDRVNIGGTSIHINQFNNYFINQRRGFGGGWGFGGPRLGWGLGGFGLGFGAGLMAAHWNPWWYDNFMPIHHRGWYHGAWGWDPMGAWHVPWVYSYSNWGHSILPYRLGYVRYVNPYWVDPLTTTVVYDYQQPVIVERPIEQAAAVVDDGEQAALDLLDASLAAFQATDYARALQHVDESLQLNPNDPAAHELRALALFAMGRYTESAATLNSLLAAAPGWDWPTMRGLYPSTAVYTDQLRALESYRNANPQSADARFVLAYHYLVAGHTEAAERELARVVELEPRDRVASQILGGLQAQSQAPAEGEPLPPAAAELPVPQEAEADEVDLPEVPLPGAWNARPEEGVAIDLVMDEEESRFTWTVTQDGQSEVIEGTYSINGPLLILEDGDGGAMLARLVPEGEDRFRFVMLGAPESDPGLQFQRQP